MLWELVEMKIGGGIIFLSQRQFRTHSSSNREAAICAMLMILAPIWSLTQDDKAHESAFKNCFHAGVFRQPELGMEHKQHRNADVQAESWRPESKYSTDLANRKILLTWNLEVFDLKSWWIKF